MIVEWNAHIFSADTEKYPFHPRAAYVPGEDARFDDPLAEYMARMSTEEIDRAVLVHPEPYGDDHSVVLDCLQREPDLFRTTCLYYPDDPDGPAKMEKLVAQRSAVIATRFHRHQGKDLYFQNFSDPGVQALWETAAGLGLWVELHIGPDFASQAQNLIKTFPQTRVLIDHLAEPHSIDGNDYSEVLALGKLDNVYMKLSGLNHFMDDGPLYEEAKPFTRLVSDAFGADRMVWGSGSPRIVDAHLGHWPEADRDKVRGGNLQQLLGF